MKHDRDKQINKNNGEPDNPIQNGNLIHHRATLNFQKVLKTLQ